MKLRIILIAITTLLIGSCSKKNITKGHLKFSSGYLALEIPFDGGIFLSRKNLATGEIVKIQMQRDQVVEIPSSNYDIMFVVFTGPNIKSGTKYCAILPNQKIEGSETIINVTITTANCALASIQPYITELMSDSPSGNLWDHAFWEQGTWGP